MAIGSDSERVPVCPGDGMQMIATIAGWRCPLCGLGVLPDGRGDRARAIAAHPASG